MPLVRIDLLEGRPAVEREAICDGVDRALVDTLDVPDRDRFQIVAEHPPERFSFDRSYLGIERSDRFVLVAVTLSAGRSREAKQRFYAELCDLLGEAIGLRAEDLAVVLIENEREDWSFGHGQASHLVLAPDDWR
jgi:4-oxalocrotonate tautomerase